MLSLMSGLRSHTIKRTWMNMDILLPYFLKNIMKRESTMSCLLIGIFLWWTSLPVRFVDLSWRNNSRTSGGLPGVRTLETGGRHSFKLMSPAPPTRSERAWSVWIRSFLISNRGTVSASSVYCSDRWWTPPMKYIVVLPSNRNPDTYTGSRPVSRTLLHSRSEDWMPVEGGRWLSWIYRDSLNQLGSRFKIPTLHSCSCSSYSTSSVGILMTMFWKLVAKWKKTKTVSQGFWLWYYFGLSSTSFSRYLFLW